MVCIELVCADAASRRSSLAGHMWMGQGTADLLRKEVKVWT